MFDWKIVSGHTATQLLQEVKRMMINELKIQPRRLPGLHRLHVDVQRHRLDEKEKKRHSVCEINQMYPNVPAFYTAGRWTFLAPEMWICGMELCTRNDDAAVC